MTRTVMILVALLLCMTVQAAPQYSELIESGVEARNQGDFVTAESMFRQAMSTAEQKQEAALLLGMVIAFQERFDDALDVIERALQASPDYIPLRLAKARVLSYQGEYDRALAIAEPLAREHIDASILAARVSLYQGRFLVGRQRFSDVLRRDPENIEALVGLYDSERYLGESQAAERILAKAEQLAPESPEVIKRRERRQSPGSPRHELISGYSGSRFDIPLDRWHERFIEYRHISESGNQQFIRLESARRFATDDTRVEAGVLVRADTASPLTLTVGATDGAEFLPELSVSGELGFRVTSGSSNWGVTIGRLIVHHARYETGPVTRGEVLFDYYFKNSNTWLTPGFGSVRDEYGNRNSSWRLGINHQPDSHWRFGATWFDAPETIAGETIETSTLHGYVRYRANEAVWLRFDLARHDRQRAYVRRTLTMTIGYRF